MDDCEPTPDAKKALSHVMTDFLPKEKDRASTFREILQERGIDLTASVINDTTYLTDGDMQHKGFRFAIN
jgi:hypothetical protein